MSNQNDLLKKDLYALLGVSDEASEKEIVKAYRKAALKCHPDKNPDPKAAQQFHELSSILEILADVAVRAAYDNSRKAKKAAEARHRVLDSKRKKFKEDLEARERAAQERTQAAATAAAEKKLQAEIDRLRKEGSRLLEQEQERLQKEVQVEKLSHQVKADSHSDIRESVKLKLKWKADKTDSNNGGYSKDTLSNILTCYGNVSALIVSSKRNGSAIVEFDSSGVSEDICEESGLSENPFTITWLSGKPGRISKPTKTEHCGTTFSNPMPKDHPSATESSGWTNGVSKGAGESSTSTADSVGAKDFESLVLMRMRQAEERKRLIEQMVKEDEEG